MLVIDLRKQILTGRTSEPTSPESRRISFELVNFEITGRVENEHTDIIKGIKLYKERDLHEILKEPNYNLTRQHVVFLKSIFSVSGTGTKWECR